MVGGGNYDFFYLIIIGNMVFVLFVLVGLYLRKRFGFWFVYMIFMAVVVIGVLLVFCMNDIYLFAVGCFL